MRCSLGYFCLAGSQNQTSCPRGYYCPNATRLIRCDPGFYCPEFSTEQRPCPKGHYCIGIDCEGEAKGTSPGALLPIKCPLGYREFPLARRVAFNETCEPCPPGTFGADADRGVCRKCREGVVCLELAKTDLPLSNKSSEFGVNSTRSYPCPKGYYCPAGTGAPTPCPAGTFNPLERMSSLEECRSCPKNHFQHVPGSQLCLACGSEADAPERSALCKCRGGGRQFQTSDRSCPCMAGHVATDRYPGDCVRTLYERCDLSTFRWQGGQCWNRTQWESHCRKECLPIEYEGYEEEVRFFFSH